MTGHYAAEQKLPQHCKQLYFNLKKFQKTKAFLYTRECAIKKKNPSNNSQKMYKKVT